MESLEARVIDLAKKYRTTKNWDVPEDYFSWGRDLRHKVDNTEVLPLEPTASAVLPDIKIPTRVLRFLRRRLEQPTSIRKISELFRSHYSKFEDTYLLMADQYSRNLFAELIYMKLVSEKRMRLSAFTKEFVQTYEMASERLLLSEQSMQLYGWDLRRVDLDRPRLSFYTAPEIYNLHLSGRLYRYKREGVDIGVSENDILIDGGVGWGDTTIYLAAQAGGENGGQGHVFSFDILEEGLTALRKQLQLNPKLSNISPILLGLSDIDGQVVGITEPGPGAQFSSASTEREVETITIDTFSETRGLERVDMIKMDIEGAEVPALRGAAKVVRQYKPKLAISAYHKWDDLLQLPRLIHSLRDDYSFYLDCVTGFGGETVLYCQ